MHFHPGEYLRDELAARGVTVEELAEQTGLPIGWMRRFVAGHVSIGAGFAYRISEAFGQSANTWVHLQEAYDKD